MSSRAAIYARVSTDIQRDNYSVPSQIKDMLNYINKHDYYLVGDRYVNIDTGKDSIREEENTLAAFVDDFTSTELSRPGLDAALSYLKSLGFDVLVVHAIDRLARDPYFRQTIEREFMAHGARIEYVLGNYDESPEGEVRKDLDATFAKWENAKRVERSNRGKKLKAETGLFVAGKVPFGYRIDPNAFGGMIVFEPEAVIVQMVFKYFVEERLSLKQVAIELNRQGIKSYHQHDTWAISSVHRMLENSAYAGYFFYNKHKRKGKKLVWRDESEWIRIECIPIIDPDLFLAAQDILKNNKDYMRRLPKRFYLLSGMVICANCKKAYITQTTKAGRHRLKNDRQAYRHRISHGHCCNKWISAKKLEEIVWAYVVGILLNPSSIRDGYEQSIEEESKKQARQLQHYETLKKAVEKLKQKRSKLHQIYIDPDIGLSKEDYLEEKATIESQIKEANIDMEEIERTLQQIPTADDLKSLEEFASKIVSALGQDLNIKPEDKRKIMQMLNLKVLISKNGHLRLEGWFNSEFDGLSSTTY